jgi:hypothetical protein
MLVFANRKLYSFGAEDHGFKVNQELAFPFQKPPQKLNLVQKTTVQEENRNLFF